MKETELKLHSCRCGGEMRIKKVAQNGGMDGTYWNWELTCSKCGLTKTYAADGFYGRNYKTFEEVVDDWNRNQKKEELSSSQLEMRKKGKWIDEPIYKQTMDGKTWDGFTYCSECKEIHEYGYRSKFCPNCGAKMRI